MVSALDFKAADSNYTFSYQNFEKEMSKNPEKYSNRLNKKPIDIGLDLGSLNLKI